jgi:hypothetical protein
VADETREGEVYAKLLKKLEVERKALPGLIYDILGKVFVEKSLRDLLIEAIRYGEDPEVKQRLDQVIDNAIDRDRLLQLLEEKALVRETLNASKVAEVREQMERAQARRLQPHFIQSFLWKRFKNWVDRLLRVSQDDLRLCECRERYAIAIAKLGWGRWFCLDMSEFALRKTRLIRLLWRLLSVRGTLY